MIQLSPKPKLGPRFPLRLPVEQDRWVRAFAKRRKTTITDVMRAALALVQATEAAKEAAQQPGGDRRTAERRASAA